jgi:thioredoxin 2
MEGQILSSAKIRCAHCGTMNRVPVAAKGTPRCGKCHQALPWIVNAGDDSFAEVVERAALPVLVDFWAPWCGPCRQVSPALADLAGELAGKIKLVKVDVDQAPALQRRFTIQSIPTLMIFRAGKLIASQAGAAPAPVLRNWVSQALAGD